MNEQPNENPFTGDFSATLLDQIFSLWVEPAIAERGGQLTRSDVRKALVVMAPNEVPKVHLNDEARLIATVKATRNVEAGEEVTLDDFSSIEALLPGDIDPNAGWVAFAEVGDQVVVAFDVRRNRQTASSLLDRATQFSAVATVALTDGHLGPAIENCFAAAELAVKAEMFLIDDNPTRIHHERIAWWTAWVEMGNAPAGAAAVLSRLYSERAACRYGEGEISMAASDVDKALNDVLDIVRAARERGSPQLPSS